MHACALGRRGWLEGEGGRGTGVNMCHVRGRSRATTYLSMGVRKHTRSAPIGYPCLAALELEGSTYVLKVVHAH